MTPYFVEECGNASSLHGPGQRAGKAVEDARGSVAELIGAKPEEIFFTSGGTESDNWALFGAFRAKRPDPRFLVITSPCEHEAVLNACAELGREGAQIRFLQPDGSGITSPESLEEALSSAISSGWDPSSILVSLMTANNEIGTVNPVKELGAVCRRAGVLFHTDAVQAAGHIPLDVESMNIDLMSASGHKFGGPKGTGFLYVRKGVKLSPLIFGGGQERGLRSGTMNTPGIAGLGKAAELARVRMKENAARVTALRDRFEAQLLAEIPEIRRTVEDRAVPRLPGHASLRFSGVESESLLILLDMKGIAASGGSACAAGRSERSHVLKAIGLPDEAADETVRFTFGVGNTEEEVTPAAGIIRECVEKLREMRGL